jgi:uncharacterized lipoprotein YddW (UPF0748 family)
MDHIFVNAGVKVLMDGSLGGRMALLSLPHSDDPSTNGMETIDKIEIKMTVVGRGSSPGSMNRPPSHITSSLIEQAMRPMIGAYLTTRGISNPNEARRIASECSEHGIDRIYLLAKDAGSSMEFKTKTCKSKVSSGFDPFREVVRSCNDVGIQVHAWFCLYAESPSDQSDYLRSHPEALIVNRHGKSNIEQPAWSTIGPQYSVHWVCASHEGYREYLASLMRDAIDGYEIDGVHLDYVRYPEEVEGRTYCYCERCRAKLKREYGYELPVNDVIKNRYYVSVMCENVSESVERFSEVARSGGREISAYVFTDYVTAIEACYQDWPHFSRFLDVLCPTVYEVSPEYVKTLTKRARSVIAPSCRLTPAIMSSDEVRRSLDGGERWSKERTPEYVLSVAKSCVDAGSDGFVLFIYDSTPHAVLDVIGDEFR